MLPSGSTITLNTLTPFFPFPRAWETSAGGAETARGGAAHGGGFVWLHTLRSDSEAVADVVVVKPVSASDGLTCDCAADRAPLHVSRTIPKTNEHLMRERRHPSVILLHWCKIPITLKNNGPIVLLTPRWSPPVPTAAPATRLRRLPRRTVSIVWRVRLIATTLPIPGPA